MFSWTLKMQLNSFAWEISMNDSLYSHEFWRCNWINAVSWVIERWDFVLRQREVASESNEQFMKYHYKKKRSNMYIILSETQQDTFSKSCWSHEVWESAIIQISEWTTFFERDQANCTNFRLTKQDVLSRTDEVHRHATCFELCSAESTVENKLISQELITQEEFAEFLAEN